MVLHSATHLFCNEDVGNGLRDLADLDGLLREFAHEDGFWPDLTARAAELDLTRPLYYALRYVQPILNTPVPAQVLREAEIGRPPSALLGTMDAIFLRMLQPDRDRRNDRRGHPGARSGLRACPLAAHAAIAARTALDG